MRAYHLALVPLVTALLLSACTEDTTGPDVGTGNELKATINGQTVVWDVSSLASTYDVGSKQVLFGETLTGSPSKTVLLRFNYDIDKGPFPHTVSGNAINIVYTESGSSVLTYDCLGNDDHCSITITRSNGEIVDGTFNAMLSERSDSTKKVTITNGSFSIKLNRIN